MNKVIYFILPILFLFAGLDTAQAGNPDRQGEAGAYELLMNPWARSAGLHTMNTSNVTGVESMRINAAGLSRINKTEVSLSRANYLQGTDIAMNGFGLAQKVGENGAIGISLMSVDFGDIPVTTTANPEGNGQVFSPNFFNIGIGYAHEFENKVSVGITFRGVSESTSNLNAFAMAIDAGVQYVTGPQDNFKLGISLRNVGSPMRYSGEGLSLQRPDPDSDGNFNLTYDSRSTAYELPTALNIGGSYDILIGEDKENVKNKVTIIGNFTANSFSRDQLGLGLEYTFNNVLSLRAAYKYELGTEIGVDTAEAPLYTGLAAGASVNIPLSKENPNQVSIDYSYRQTKIYDGTHNFGVRISL